MSNNTLTHTTEAIKNPILLAQHFVKSGFFQDTNDLSKAVVKIVAGSELGFGPMASMSGFHIIKGKPTISSNLMGAAIKRSGKYNFRVVEHTEKVCKIEFFENKESCGISTFTIEEAVKAGTQNLQKYPKNMLYARALSNGAKWFCPDILNGSPIYTPEELGAEVDEDGEVINTTPAKITGKEAVEALILKLENNEIIDFEKSKIWLLENQAKIPTELLSKATDLINQKQNKVVNIEPNEITDEVLAQF